MGREWKCPTNKRVTCDDRCGVGMADSLCTGPQLSVIQIGRQPSQLPLATQDRTAIAGRSTLSGCANRTLAASGSMRIWSSHISLAGANVLL